MLEDGGRHDVFYAVIGKVSSNWDRMCELYAQIIVSAGSRPARRDRR